MPLDNLAGSHLEARLRREVQCEVLFDPFSRGRYSTDASIYQIEPLGVVVRKPRLDLDSVLRRERHEHPLARRLTGPMAQPSR